MPGTDWMFLYPKLIAPYRDELILAEISQLFSFHYPLLTRRIILLKWIQTDS